MAMIKTVLGIVILAAIALGGYWLYATYTITSADDEMWTQVNSRLPAVARDWACTEVKGRLGKAPAHCGGH